MRDDLLDAYAAADWAMAQLEPLQARLTEWFGRPAYSIVGEHDLGSGQALFKLKVDERIGDSLINAEVGAIINSARSSLDILASALVRRNGKTPNSDTHFPISASAAVFADPKNTAKREKWFVANDRAIIENLRPYRGGNDLIYALHHLDIIRKHERLVRLAPALTSLIITPEAHAGGFAFANPWPGFYDGAVVARAPLSAADSKYQIVLDVTLNEPHLTTPQPVMPALRDLCRLAQMIVELFE